MNRYNVFDKIYHHKSFLYWQNLRMLPRQLKWAKQRICRGFCRADWYDMDDWFAHVVADMIDEFAENTVSYSDDFKTPKEWTITLKEMSQHLRNAGIEEIAEEKFANIKNENAKCMVMNNWRRNEIKAFCELFQKYYFSLWD